MAEFNKEVLSGSTDGRPIPVVATATPGTSIHVAQASASLEDEIWIWAANTDTVARKITIEFGGVTAGDLIEQVIPAEDGLFLVIPGLPLRNALVCAAFAETTNVINLMGYVNRLS